jgi:hypothetical protein
MNTLSLVATAAAASGLQLRMCRLPTISPALLRAGGP